MFTPEEQRFMRIYDEYQRLISMYDWAVEGWPAPETSVVNREQAVEIRNNLVGLARKLCEDRKVVA